MNCQRCKDTGLVEFTGGLHWVYGNTVTEARQIEATPEAPIYKRCKCRDSRPKAELVEVERFS